MPIHPKLRRYYRKEWHKLSKQLREQRAKNRCECAGLCGGHEGPCGAEHGKPNPRTGGKTSLTCAHLHQDPRNHETSGLMVMCQSCHLRYDRQPGQMARRERIMLEILGQTTIFEKLARRKGAASQNVNSRIEAVSVPVPPLTASMRSLLYQQLLRESAITMHKASSIMHDVPGWSRATLRRRILAAGLVPVGERRRGQALYNACDVLRVMIGERSAKYFDTPTLEDTP